MSNKVSAVLFDLDGVLVDACDLHRKALDAALLEVGYTITDEEHFARYNGRPTKVKLQMLTEEKGLPVELHDQIASRKQELTLKRIPFDIRPNEGGRRLIRTLHDLGIPSSVCSNSTSQSIYRLLSYSELLDYMAGLVGNDEGFAPKPAPDLFLEGARRLGVPISECVIVEDSPIGLQAAYAAKPLRVVQVSGPHEVTIDLLPIILGE